MSVAWRMARTAGSPLEALETCHEPLEKASSALRSLWMKILKSNFSMNTEMRSKNSLGQLESIQTGGTLTLHLLEVGALEANDVLWEDSCVHVRAPHNVPLWILYVVDGAVVVVTAWVALGGSGWNGLWPTHQHTAQHDMCLAALICLC